MVKIKLPDNKNKEPDWNFKDAPIDFSNDAPLIDYGKDTCLVLLSYYYIGGSVNDYNIGIPLRVTKESFRNFLEDYYQFKAFGNRNDNDEYVLYSVYQGKIIWEKDKFKLVNYQYGSGLDFGNIFDRIKNIKDGKHE